MTKKNPYKGPDRFTVEAKKAGYPARSVFKLEEIDKRVRVFRTGMHVLDLGCAPGSWSMYAAQKIGRAGKLLAMDLTPLSITLPAPAEFFVGDALSLSNDSLKTYAPYDVVLSDMAPGTTGNRLGDQTRSFELFMRAADIAVALLKPGGVFIGKIFMGEDLPIARAFVKKHFDEERLIRPEGTRQSSYELFCLGIGRKNA